jgi:5'-nucleotidase
MILISNDDGYQAKGIQFLLNIVKDYDDVLVCAPDAARSGFACAFTANDPLYLTPRHQEQGVEVWSCNGTPVDCVKMALAELCTEKPRLILGGINHGDNSSVNTHYSGTMGVTMEGCMKYIPSVAFSLCDHRADADFRPLEPYIRDIVQCVLRDGLPKGVCLNVNFPLLQPTANSQEPTAYKGVRICRMSPGTWMNEVRKCEHPRGGNYWWMVGSYVNDEPEATDTDRWALDNGYVAITPTRIDVTAYEAMEELKRSLNIDH